MCGSCTRTNHIISAEDATNEWLRQPERQQKSDQRTFIPISCRREASCSLWVARVLSATFLKLDTGKHCTATRVCEFAAYATRQASHVWLAKSRGVLIKASFIFLLGFRPTRAQGSEAQAFETHADLSSLPIRVVQKAEPDLDHWNSCQKPVKNSAWEKPVALPSRSYTKTSGCACVMHGVPVSELLIKRCETVHPRHTVRWGTNVLRSIYRKSPYRLICPSSSSCLKKASSSAGNSTFNF